MKSILATFLLMLSFAVQTPVRAADPPEEKLCKAFAVHMEARGEPLAGQRAVLDIIHNRMWYRKLSACGVVKQRKQFSWYEAGMEFKLGIKELTHYERVVRMPSVLSKKVSHFHAIYVQPAWAGSMRQVGRIGKHIFYTDKE